ncbi:DUF4247 domain-containing protein [Actinomadura darangshiensis]|uniref:DUF4247 domain-containing protein n=1 Tax=Actinomadura darangshiensis TaxID=705336 RepID=A0A4R5AUG9_9ACTN|nr:DUF4247 domain-containing protein [Actinomadura darangshiensis]
MGGAVVAAVVTATALSGCGQSQKSWLGDKYTKMGSGQFRSPKPPQTVAGEIGRKFKPIDRVSGMTTVGSGGGIFLRYPKLVVGVLPNGPGSRITLDNARSGYNRYHSYVGNRWSRPGSGGWTSSGAASFRGGGPGSGK